MLWKEIKVLLIICFLMAEFLVCVVLCSIANTMITAVNTMEVYAGFGLYLIMFFIIALQLLLIVNKLMSMSKVYMTDE